MKLSQFKYHLPQEQIALFPTEERDEARMMVLHRKTQTIEHKIFKDIVDYFDEGDIFVTNNTKVFRSIPEARAVWSKYFVTKHKLTVLIKTKLKLSISNDDSVSLSMLVALLVNCKSNLLNLCSQLFAKIILHILQCNVDVVTFFGFCRRCYNWLC